MAKKERMKNGLDSLFEDNFHFDEYGNETNEEKGDIQNLRLSLIEPDRNQPRTHFDEDKLNVLADNIRQHGILQPILVRPMGSGNDSYQIVAGERRWRAARIAELTEIPALVRDLTDVEAAQIALIENVQRTDLNPIEEAKAYKRLSDEFGMTQEKISKIVGKSRASIANSMRILKITDEAQKALLNNEISVGHAKILAGVDSEETQNILVKQVIEDEMSVRKFEVHVENVISGKYARDAQEKNEKKSANIKTAFGDNFKAFALQTELSMKEEFGLNASVKSKKDGSIKFELSFETEDEFKEALKLFAVK